MIDFQRYRDQLLRFTNDWDVEVMESTDEELREVYEEVSSLVKGGEEGLGARDYCELHVAQILEVMIRWELRLRSTGEELPGVPYDPARTAAEERRNQARRRAWSEAN
ncbi:MAG TPA: hypothetical protein VK797_16440 [Tepidisphaeraceae bacterium]|nr:hypothetical protein [Tepidisphaeraceae bacterium]